MEEEYKKELDIKKNDLEGKLLNEKKQVEEFKSMNVKLVKEA